jgi:hypothetical protein
MPENYTLVTSARAQIPVVYSRSASPPAECDNFRKRNVDDPALAFPE